MATRPENRPSDEGSRDWQPSPKLVKIESSPVSSLGMLGILPKELRYAILGMACWEFPSPSTSSGAASTAGHLDFTTAARLACTCTYFASTYHKFIWSRPVLDRAI